MTTCPKCGGYSYKVEEVEPNGSRFKLYFIQCSSCNTPVGVTEYFNGGAMLQQIEDKLANLSSNIEQMDYKVTQIQYKLANK
ncbi:MAG: hypothetical protein V1487_03600 [bacterium]